MLIQSYGLFWKANEIDWYPGKGARTFRLLGRRGVRVPNLEIADFMHQQGIYILYGNFGPYYVGLTKRQGLGKRLKDHHEDHLAEKWDRFSWFGFCNLRSTDKTTGLRPIKPLPKIRLGDPNDAIGDIEALLIKAMNLTNIRQMNFHGADEWKQIEENRIEHYLRHARPG